MATAAPPALEAAADAGGAEAPAAPAPGLTDDDLERLDASVDTAPPPASAMDAGEPADAVGDGAADPAPATEVEAEPASPLPATAAEPDLVAGPPSAATDPAPDDRSAVEGEVAAAARTEVDEASAEGAEPAIGGGGGGGGAAIEDQPDPPAPEISAAPPEQAMSTLATLRPTQMANALGGVQSAAAGAVARERTRLAATPPRHTPLAGATSPAAASDLVPDAAPPSTARVERATAGPSLSRPTALPARIPAPIPTGQVPPPRLAAAPEGGLTPDSARDLAATINRLPVQDPATRATPGPAPELRLVGEADPGQVATQQAHLMTGVAQARGEGERDAAEPLGEDAVRPTVPVETLEAEPVAGPAAGAAGGPATGSEPGRAAADGPGAAAAVDAVVEEQSGPAIRASASAAAQGMLAARREQAEQEQSQRSQAALQIAALEQQHAEAETAERTSVHTEAADQRRQWRAEQHALVAGAHAEAAATTAQAGGTIAAERSQARAEADQAHAQGQQEAAQARQQGEQEAARHRAEAQSESSGGFLGWVASRATALFDRVKQGISAAFERARQAVRAAIERAQQLAVAVIERARQAVVAAIRAAGAVLTAIGDRLLAGFPALRDRFRSAIRQAVRRAESAVNRLAEGLKSGVRAALGLLGRGLTALLSGLEAGLKAAVDSVAATVRGAISAARSALQAVGAFLAIAKDVAANPAGWLRNLAAAVLDGIRNHLWQALKTAVQQWFNDKVEQVLGLGRAVWNLLTRGGISLAQIGRMAWEGIKQAIPAALIGLLIEKLASMIVPAAGAVLAIIQGLQAAWGAVSRVLQAIDRFITFLKAVKSGNAGPAFAQAVAAAGVAVVDFVSNWLLARLARGASAVAGRIRAIAQRIGAALRRVATRIGAAVRRIGGRIGQRLRGLRDRFRDWRQRRRARRGERPEDRRRRLEERLDRAVAAIQPQLDRLLARGVSGLRLRARLLFWKVRYRLTALAVNRTGGQAEIWATVNPRRRVRTATTLTPQHLRTVVNQAVRDTMRDTEVRQRLRSLRAQVRDDPSRMNVSGGEGWGAATQHLRNEGPGRAWPRQQRTGTHGSELGQGLETTERRSPHWFGPGPTSAFVTGVGTYPEIARDLRATGMSDPVLARHLHELVRTGVAPRSLSPHQAQLMSNLSWLMFGRESHRNRRNLAHAAMTVDLIRSGNMSFHDAFARYEPGGGQSRTGGRGMFPMSMKGAERAAMELNPQDPRIARPAPTNEPSQDTLENRRRNRVELERRETELVTRWVTVRLEREQGLMGLSAQAIGDAVRRMVREFFGRA